MLKKITSNSFIPFICLLFTHVCWAATDTLPNTDLTFHSTFERQLLEQYRDKQPVDTFALLFATDSTSTHETILQAQQQLAAFYESIAVEGEKKRKNLKKYIDFLFSSVQTQFLKKYDINVDFPQIFKSGAYHCVTATALYALVFEHCGIPYEIKELPTHVYLIADPQGLSIQIETTDPKNGYFVPSDKFK